MERTSHPEDSGETGNTETLSDIRSRVIDKALAVFAILMIPALIISIARTIYTGWKSLYYLQIVVVAVLGLVILLRRKLHTETRVWIVLISCLVLAIGGMLQFGLLSASGVIFSTACILATVLLGERAGAGFLALAATVTLAVVIILRNRLADHTFDVFTYLSHPVSWVGEALALLLFTGVTVAVMGTVRRALLRTLRSLSSRNAELEQAYTSLAAEAAERRRLEEEKQQFYRDTIGSVTDGKLRLVDREETTEVLRSAEVHSAITDPESVSGARGQVKDFCTGKGLSGDNLDLFLVGVGEDMTNALKHAGGGEVAMGSAEGAVWVGVSDTGPGIPTLALPSVAFRRAYSTKASLGMGYSIMMDVADRITLSTGREGATVILTKLIGKEKPCLSLDDLSDTW